MKFRHSIFILILILLPSLASAQFYVTGDDPGKAKWFSIETDNFQIIYPQGADSLARVYARKIENMRVPVSLSSGYISGEGDGKKMPVVLHAYNDSNGSVAWAPKRMDLFSIPSAYNPEPIPWTNMLSIHESRHVTQMQFGQTKALKPGNWFFGEMWNILSFLVFPSLSNAEGDAVITETAWTPSGRGRTADFLNYYWVAFDQGDFRKWHHWNCTSQRKNAPDHYSLGYLTIGGLRYLYDCPQYMDTLFHYAALKPYDLGAYRSMVKKITGKKFNDVFMEISDSLYGLWSADAEARKPYIDSEVISPETRIYTDYKDILIIGKEIYAIKEGHADVPTLVRIDSTGRERRISSYSYSASRPQWSSTLNRLYWSETRTDARWSLMTKSKIRYMEDDFINKYTLKNEALLHNPAPADSLIATIKYEPTGRHAVEIINAVSGKTLKSFTAPEGIQPVELAWIGDIVYISAISDNGYGIYSIDTRKYDGWKVELAAQPVMIQDFASYGNELMFTCDRSGVNELYHFNPSNGELRQKTSTRYGSKDFRYSDDGQWLYYTSQTYDGIRIFRTQTSQLLNKETDFTKLHHYPIADKVTLQERELAKSKGVDFENILDREVSISQPKKYSKALHALNVHSWAPAYLNVDKIMGMSFNNIWEAASLGASGIIQNKLSTMSGGFGYSAHQDPYSDTGKWRHSGHIYLTYSGLYPVFELSLDFNDRGARSYDVNAYVLAEENSYSMEIKSNELPHAYIDAGLSTYIPFRFSAGGWYKGITPKLTYNIGNDYFDTGINFFTLEGEDYIFSNKTKGKKSFRHSISASLSAYIVQNTPSSAVYPRWGMGAEFGASRNFDSWNILSPMAYGYFYGYLPGILNTQGLRFSVLSQIKLNDAPFGQAAVSILPRGLSSSANLTQWLSIRYPLITKFSVDYAIPIYIGEVAIGGNFFNIKRLTLTPNFDYTYFSEKNLWSVGTTLDLDLHSIFGLNFPITFGVKYSYNGGSVFEELSAIEGLKLNRHYVGPNFNLSF